MAHMSVYENVAFPLRLRKLPAAEIEQRTKDALTATNLLKSANESPASLSGGGKQRVALARALAINLTLCCLTNRFRALTHICARKCVLKLKTCSVNTVFHYLRYARPVGSHGAF